MTKDRFLLAVSLVVVVGISALTLIAVPAELSIYSNLRSWAPTVHVTLNSYHMWRIDPLTALLTEIVFGDGTSMGAIAVPIQVSIFTAGTLLLFTTHAIRKSSGPAWRRCMPVFVGMLPLLVCGRDEVTLGALEWLPWLTMLFIGACTTTKLSSANLPHLVAFVFVSFLNSWAGNQYAIITSTLCLSLASGFSGSGHEGDSSTPQMRFLAPLCIPFLFALYPLLTAPLAPFPDYPSDATLVQDDGLAGIIRPNLGTDYPLTVSDRPAIKTATAPVAIVLSLGCLLAAVVKRRNGAKLGAFDLFTLCVSVLLASDAILPERFAVSLPVQALARNIPGLGVLPFCMTLAAVLAWSTCLHFRQLGVTVSIGLGLLIVKFCAPPPLFDRWLAPPLSTEESLLVSRMAFDLPPERLTLLVSPSLHVIRNYSYLFIQNGVFSVEAAARTMTASSTPSASLLEKVVSEPPSPTPSLHLIADGDGSTRWTPGGGTQKGGESLLLYFKEPLVTAGLSISSGAFQTDYPRGINISFPNECSRPHLPAPTISFSKWHGPLMFSANGFPYFGRPDDVRVPFPSDLTLLCVHITQTGKDSHYDWSVAEIGILKGALK